MASPGRYESSSRGRRGQRLTLAYATERRLRPRVTRPLVYDDWLVPGQIVASVMHRPPWASVLFGATLMSATLTLLALLGRIPSPWRRPPDVLAASIGTHVAYVCAVAAVDNSVRGDGKS